MKKLQIIFAIISIVIIASISIFAQNSSIGTLKKTDDAPDLIIEKFVFVNTNDKALRVYVHNKGNQSAVANRLLLTVGKINGVVVNRKKVVTVPSLENDKGVWLFINAKSILPNDVAIKSTYFRLIVDATEIITERNESNNNEYYTGKDGPISAADFQVLTPELKDYAPDLRIRRIKFSESNDKVMNVQVYNGGNADAGATEFLLAIGKINDTKVNRRENYKMPPLPMGKDTWVEINAETLLPNSVSLKSTLFRLTVDMPDIISEPNEENNNYYHNKP